MLVYASTTKGPQTDTQSGSYRPVVVDLPHSRKVLSMPLPFGVTKEAWLVTNP